MNAKHELLGAEGFHDIVVYAAAKPAHAVDFTLPGCEYDHGHLGNIPYLFEYFKSVDRKVLKARVVECVFEERKGAQYKVVSFFAKRARGLMARWAAQHKAATPRALQAFDLERYAFAAAASDADRLVFRRSHTPS